MFVFGQYIPGFFALIVALFTGFNILIPLAIVLFILGLCGLGHHEVHIISMIIQNYLTRRIG